MAKTILITGGTGLIGRNLTATLLQKGYKVQHLSRRYGKEPGVKTFIWNPAQTKIDEQCLEQADTIIHLAGTRIGDKRWTAKRKQEIVESRTKSIRLIYDLMKKRQHRVEHIISASGIGYYSDRGNDLMTEEDLPANDFLGQVCVEWEKAVDEGEPLGLKTAKLRTGIVLTNQGGALPKIAAPIKWGIGAPIGNGHQWISWIHLEDVVNLYIFAIENELSGVYNMVAPHPVSNRTLTKSLAKILKKPLWLPPVPAVLLQLALGELSTLVLGSTHVSASKIEDRGYNFKFPYLEEALTEIYKK